jgi:hypothetical protein
MGLTRILLSSTRPHVPLAAEMRCVISAPRAAQKTRTASKLFTISAPRAAQKTRTASKLFTISASWAAQKTRTASKLFTISASWAAQKTRTATKLFAIPAPWAARAPSQLRLRRGHSELVLPTGCRLRRVGGQVVLAKSQSASS